VKSYTLSIGATFELSQLASRPPRGKSGKLPPSSPSQSPARIADAPSSLPAVYTRHLPCSIAAVHFGHS
jgi:hypothetical protein